MLSVARGMTNVNDSDLLRRFVDFVKDEVRIAAYDEHPQARRSRFGAGHGKKGQALDPFSYPGFHRACRSRVMLSDIFENEMQIA